MSIITVFFCPLCIRSFRTPSYIFILPMAVSLFLGLSVTVHAQDQTNNPPEVTGSLSGVVSASVQGASTPEPLPNLIVTAYRQDDDSYYEDWVAYKTATTGSDGQYIIDRLVTDIYRIGVSDPNGIYLSGFYSGTTSLEDAVDIPVAGDAVAQRNLVLVKGGTIGGTVTDQDAVALAEISVTAYYRTAFKWEIAKEMETDASGHYLFETLSPGVYTLGFSDHDDYYDYYDDMMSDMYVEEYYDNAFSLAAASEITITGGAVFTDVNAQLELYGGITGTVTVSDSEHASITIEFYSSDDDFQQIYATSTFDTYYGEDTVSYTFDALRAGTYLVKVSAYDWYSYEDDNSYLEFYDNAQTFETATQITVISGQTTPDIDFFLDTNDLRDTAAKATLQGTVLSSSGAPIEGIHVSIRESCSYEFDYYSECRNNYWSEIAIGVTNADGDYTIPNIWPDTYTVHFRDPNVIGGTAQLPSLFTYVNQVHTKRLKVGANNLDSTLLDGGVIVGTVSTWDGLVPSQSVVTLYEFQYPFWIPVSTQIAAGNPDPYSDPYIYSDYKKYPASPYPLTVDPEYGSALLPASSGFAFMGLPTGDYRVGVAGRYENEEFEHFYSGVDNISNAVAISVTPGVITDNIALVIGEDNANSSIEGIVTAGNTPQAGIRVELYKAADFGSSYNNVANWNLLVFAITDSAGFYSFKGLELGEYKLRFSIPDSNELPVYYGGSYSVEEAQVITLATSSASVNMSLDGQDPGGTAPPDGPEEPDRQFLYMPFVIR